MTRVDEHTTMFRLQQRLITLFGSWLMVLNALMTVGTATIAIGLWMAGRSPSARSR